MATKHIFTAIIVSAGKGLRMHSEAEKQFMNLGGRKIVEYSLGAFEKNPNIDHIVLVVPGDKISETFDMCLGDGFTKVCSITEGGKERYNSVFNGLKQTPKGTDYVLIHDGVRPCLSQELIDRCCKCVAMSNACIAAVPVRDTIKKTDERGYVLETPDRRNLWDIQTPQAFSFSLIENAYRELLKTLEDYGSDASKITDDSIIVENMTNTKVRLIEGDERNIKITTPSDLIVAEAFLKSMDK